MKLTSSHKKPVDWPRLIREYRESLGLSRAEFGARYGAVRQTVFYWEIGKNEAPYSVTWDIFMHELEGLK